MSTARSQASPALAGPPAQRRALRQTVWITVAAALVYVGVRSLPVDRGSLHYDDFHAGGVGVLEFCEPGGPQFVPVDRVKSPVSLEIVGLRTGDLRRGEPASLIARLTSASGQPVTEHDLLIVHTEKLHLLLVDASLDDYQHLHPAPTSVPGEFAFTFTPRAAGGYRVFADFMPRATGRALYAGARIDVADSPGALPRVPVAAAKEVFRADGLVFSLVADRESLRINETATLRLAVSTVAGAPVELEEVMGARAHLVAFDQGRTGFAHLHPLASEGAKAATQAQADDPGDLAFELHLTDPGDYRLWAQVKIAGRERFAPFNLHVVP